MKNKFLLTSFSLLFFLLFTACDTSSPGVIPESVTYRFDDLHENDIFMVKVNTSTFIIPAANTGRVRNFSPDLIYPRFQEEINFSADTAFYSSTVSPPGHPAAREFSANPPPIIDEVPVRSRSGFTSPEVGDKRSFLIESFLNSRVFIDSEATLRATGCYGNIWVLDIDKDRITDIMAEDLAALFDDVYRVSTNILGYEYGGGPDGNGGRDGDSKIQILIHDIVDGSGDVVAAGYFWGKDFYPKTQSTYSNEAEIFYIDTSHVMENFGFMPYLLVHELQHMINFNIKYIQNGKSAATWYNELLSMMAEEIISSAVTGVSQSDRYHPLRRMSLFLDYYYLEGMTEWPGLERLSYAKAYAFGAYLSRNFGGVELLREIMSNDRVDIESLSLALNKLNPGMDFKTALVRLGEAMIYSGDSVTDDIVTFDRSVTNEINGISYTAEAFDIWKPNDHFIYGPTIGILTPFQMRPHSIIIHSDLAWLNVSGSISIDVEKPLNPNVEIYFLVK